MRIPKAKYKNIKKFLIFFAFVLVLQSSLSIYLYASDNATNSTGYTVAYNNDGKLQIVQDAYLPVGSYLDLNLSAAEDLFIMDNAMYIADTGNKRILRIRLDNGKTDVLGEGFLRTPTGVAADKEGRIYVADSGNNEAYRFNKNLELEQVFTKPDTPNFGIHANYKPLKVAPSKDGGVYLINEGSVAGLVHMDRYGGFLGYFGASEVSVNPFYAMADKILTEEQKALFLSRTPPSFATIIKGPDDLIYSVNRGNAARPVKHNIGGDNILQNSQMPRVQNAMDIDVSDDGRILVLDSDGYITEITPDGYLINIFAGPSNTERAGLFTLPTGIATDHRGYIYVLDKEKNNIQIFAPTQSQSMLHKAISDYRQGNYEESITLLTEVLRVNNSSRLAHTYMGKNYVQYRDYEAAAEHFHISEQIADYSGAFWEIRNDWIQANLFILILIFALIIAFFIMRKSRKRKRNRAINKGEYVPGRWETIMDKNAFLYDLKQISYAVFHPTDNAYEISVGRTGSFASASFIYVLALVLIVALRIGSGFIFSERIRNFSLSTFSLGFIVFLALFIGCNFFIVAIRDGKGTLADIYETTAYAFAPMLFIFPIATILGNFMTLNEGFIYHFLVWLAVIWSVILLVSSYMQIHQYSLGKTISTLLLALFAMAVVVIVISLIWLVVQQMIQQIQEIHLEVTLHD